MELRLQQAIVATRAGRTDVAQVLLTQLINENPDEANAWFLLSHIVDGPERQTLYLRKAIELEPENAIAKQRLLQLENGPIPAPIIPQQPMLDNQQAAEEHSFEETLLETETETTPQAELPPAKTEFEERDAETQIDGQMTNDQMWPEMAGRPVREKREEPAQVAVSTGFSSSQDNLASETSDSASSEVWLVRVLVIMVVLAAIVLGILVLLILL